MSLTQQDRELILNLLDGANIPGKFVDQVALTRNQLRGSAMLTLESRQVISGFLLAANIPGKIVVQVAGILEKLEANQKPPRPPLRGATEAEEMCDLPDQAE